MQELVERHGADVDLPVHENPREKAGLTALCIAAARGMPAVTRYLLQKRASPTIRCTGRFQLHSNKRKTVKCTLATPLEFAMTMRRRELEEGASEHALHDLDKCIRMLQKIDTSITP
jgi:ankyrin repeat protein